VLLARKYTVYREFSPPNIPLRCFFPPTT